jgi:tetratricopeptide (TPR) repeat protein
MLPPLHPAPLDFDRHQILSDAARARAAGRRHRAIALYRWVLAVEPRNGEVHLRLAPLLAETGQSFDAWLSYRSAARAFLRAGYRDNALIVYREASRALQRDVRVWEALSHLYVESEQPDQAIEALLEGSRQFRGRWERPQSIHLLRLARELKPWGFEICLELARLLALSDQEREAELLLQGLAVRVSGARLRQVRQVQFLSNPTPRSFWRWLEACWETRGSAPDPGPPHGLPTPASRG